MSADTEIEYGRFESFVERHSGTIGWLCLLRAWGDAELALDLQQEVLATLWQLRARLRPDASESEERSWVRRVTLTVGGRAAQRWRADARLADECDLPADTSDAERDETLNEIAAFLSADERDLLHLRLAGYSHKETAAALGISAAAARHRYSRLVAKMAEIYNKIEKEAIR